MAAYAFQSCGSNAVPLLLPRLKDRNPAVREACVASLSGLMRSSMSTTEIISMFLPFLDDTDPMVRGSAVSLIGQLGPTASNAIPALIRNLQSNQTGRHKFASETVLVEGARHGLWVGSAQRLSVQFRL
jgi:HEAT repeat protein